MNNANITEKIGMDIYTSGQLRMTVYASLLAALTAAGAYIAIPVNQVPVVLQNFFIFLCGLLLGSRWGAASVAVYILAGACGLPIFSVGRPKSFATSTPITWSPPRSESRSTFEMIQPDSGR